MKLKRILFLTLVICFTVIWLFRLIPCIVLENLDKKEIIFVQPMSLQDEVTIGWTHSVEQLPWEEVFRIDHNQLILDRTRFKTFGAGVPSETLGKSKMEDGWIVYYDLDQPMPALTYSISKRGRHMLTYRGQSQPLYEALPDATPVSVSARVLTRIQLIQLFFSARAGMLK